MAWVRPAIHRLGSPLHEIKTFIDTSPDFSHRSTTPASAKSVAAASSAGRGRSTTPSAPLPARRRTSETVPRGRRGVGPAGRLPALPTCGSRIGLDAFIYDQVSRRRCGATGAVVHRSCPQGLPRVVDCRERAPATGSGGRAGHGPGPDRLDRRGTRPGGPTLVASPRQVALHAHQRDGARPDAAGMPTRSTSAGGRRGGGKLPRIIHCGHLGGIIVTGSVTENVSTVCTPDSGASRRCRPASTGQTSRHGAPHLQGGGCRIVLSVDQGVSASAGHAGPTRLAHCCLRPVRGGRDRLTANPRTRRH